MLEPEILRQSLLNVESPSILVIGDIMLDWYSWGKVERISPEAPIPVLKVEREEKRLGGAANTMTNLAALGANVYGCGVVGQDTSAQTVISILDEQKINYEGLIKEKNFRTILKHRMISGQHHLLRMDFDPPEKWKPTGENQMISYIEEIAPKVDIIVISDYGKGCVSPAILNTIRRASFQNNLKVIVDPKKGANYFDYKNFTLIKPNRKEAEQEVGFKLEDLTSILKAAQKIKEKASLEYVILSLDKDGLLLYQEADNYSLFETETLEIFDVVGAGDMVISLLAFLLANNAPVEHAAFWANMAAGMEITHVGVVSFTKDEILQHLDLGYESHKIVTISNLLKNIKKENLPINLTFGYFDNISSGHIKFLQQLKKFKGVLVVAINSDLSIENQKGQKPLLNEKERAYLLASIEAVDWIVIFNESDANNLIRNLRPNTVIKGERFQNKELPESQAIKEINAKLHYLKEY